MKTEFSIGDYVGILEGTEKGYITRIEKNKAWFETVDGFEITAPLQKLVKYPKKGIVKKTAVTKTVETKKENPEKFPLQKKPLIRKVKDREFTVNPSLIGEEKKHHSKKQQENIWEVDLHIEELTDHYKHLTNGEIVDAQLKHARLIIEKARNQKINKVVFIHGKGKGTLRQELLHLLAGYTFLECYDASFKRYGGGATEVRIFTSKA
jgi:dsDNA-specific endonuclease/ATPase MutS2